MKILVAEYASALGLGGTVELEGRAMLAALVKSFALSGHDVVYPTGGLKLDEGQPVLIKMEEDFEAALLEDLAAGLEPHRLSNWDTCSSGSKQQRDKKVAKKKVGVT